MNINANEIMLLKRKNNVKLGEDTPQTTSTVTDPTVTTSENGMKALEIAANNNITFQGLNASKLKNLPKYLAVAAGLAMASLSTTSCEGLTPDIEVKQEVTVDLDLSAITALQQQMLEMYKEMLAQQKLTNEQMTQMNAYMLQLMAMVQEGQLSTEAFQEKMLEFMLQNEVNQGIIIDQLVSNGLTQEKANELIASLMESIENGQIKEAYDKLMEVLNGISGGLDGIKAQFEKLLNICEQMKNQQVISNEKYDTMIGQLGALYNEVLNGNKTQEEFFEDAYNYMVMDTVNQQIIIQQLMLNGLSQQEANNLLKEIMAEVKAGNMTEAEALEKIMSQLDNVNGTLDRIAAQMDKLTQVCEQMRNQQVISNEKYDTMIAQLGALYNEVVAGNMTQEEFFKNAYKYMILDEANQRDIIKQLVINGYEQGKANELLQEIIKEVKAGNMTEAEALEKIVSQLGDINASLDVIKAQMDKLTQVCEQMRNQQVISNEKYDTMIAQLGALYNEVVAGNMTQEEFFKAAYNYMIVDTANQQFIIKQLVINGYEQGKANELLQKLIKEVKAGNMTEAEALDKIVTELGNISETLTAVLAELKNVSSKFDKFHSDYMEGKKETLTKMDQLIFQDKIQISYLEDLYKGQKEMNNNLKQVNVNLNELKKIAKDDTKFKELIKAIKTMDKNSVDYKKIEEMFKLLNMNIQEGLNESSDKVVDAIENFQGTYIKTEEGQTELLGKIYNKFDTISKFPGLEIDGLKDSIDKLTDAVNKNTEDVTAELDGIQAQLDKVLAKLDSILKEVSSLSNKVSNNHKVYLSKWQEALGYLQNFDKDMDSLIKGQKTAQLYMDALLKAIEDLKKELKNLEGNGGTTIVDGGMTLEELKEYMSERDAGNFDKLQTMLDGLNLDQLIGDVATIKDLVASLDEKADLIKDYSAQLTDIIDLLKGIDTTDPAVVAKLQEIKDILETFENCTCNCGRSDESVPDKGDLEDVLG